ncbi:hypothetical protein UlMin_012250 [Ulmus minor]
MGGFQLGSTIGLTVSPIFMKSLLESKPKTSKVMPPFRRLLSKMTKWSLIVTNAMHSWDFFVILSWMPVYFNYVRSNLQVYHADLRQAAWYSAIPWSVMAIMGYFGGLWSDMLIQSGNCHLDLQNHVGSIGFFGPAIALAGLTTTKHPSTASEIAPQYSGVLHVIKNICLPKYIYIAFLYTIFLNGIYYFILIIFFHA